MSFLAHTQVLIPALNEEESIGETVGRWLDLGANCVRVVDNGSVDATALRARAAGADVVHEPARGYGAAAWTGLQHWPADVPWVLFSSGDGSDRIEPADLCSWQAAVDDGADLVLGDRTQSSVSRSVLKPAQSVGNRICCQAISLGWGATFQDMASLRLVRHDPLMSLGLKDRGFGWNLEMQVRAVERGWRWVEVPVRYHAREWGLSKISGTWMGTVRAAGHILPTLALLWLARQSRARASAPVVHPHSSRL